MSLALRSLAFAHLGDIPSRYTCDDADVSPPLAWEQLPPGTRSLVLIVDDPDAPDPAAPQRVWVHWVVYGLPPDVARVDEGASPDALPDGAREARNDFGRTAWGGPCPPIGRHRYYFRLHALDVTLGDLGPSAGRREVEDAMRGHVLATAELMGTYERPRGAHP
ncbi:MAG: YbhB/YbcL family Raf kinase inhibitor-like protein [Gemmatirosa sp.]